jgi:hypothetical protein
MSALDRDAEVLTEVERTDWGADASADWDDRFPERSFVHVEALRVRLFNKCRVGTDGDSANHRPRRPGAEMTDFDATKHEPPPTKGKKKVLDLVLKDLTDRAEVGKERYGTYLEIHNGRDALMDAYQEALDLSMYLRQAMEERAEVVLNEAAPLDHIPARVYATGIVCPVCAGLVVSCSKEFFVCGECSWAGKRNECISVKGDASALGTVVGVVAGEDLKEGDVVRWSGEPGNSPIIRVSGSVRVSEKDYLDPITVECPECGAETGHHSAACVDKRAERQEGKKEEMREKVTREQRELIRVALVRDLMSCENALRQSGVVDNPAGILCSLLRDADAAEKRLATILVTVRHWLDKHEYIEPGDYFDLWDDIKR